MFPIRCFIWKHPVLRPFSFVGLLSFQVPPGVLDSAENWGKLIYSMQTTVLCKDPCCSSLKTHQMILNASCILYCHKTAYWEYALCVIYTPYRQKKKTCIYFISAPADRKKVRVQNTIKKKCLPAVFYPKETTPNSKLKLFSLK